MDGLALSVVLPTYDEAENIVPLIRAVRGELTGIRHEIIVVDDDSPDGTWRLAQAEAALSPGIRVLRRIGRRGLTSAISEGIAASRGALVGWLDCDLSMPPRLLPVLVEKIGEGAEVAVGSRYVAGGADARDGAPMRRLASRVIVALARAVLMPSFHDYTSGFVVARREVLDAVALRGDHGEYFIDFIVRAHRRGARITEVPYALTPRVRGTSKTDAGFLRHGARYLATVARLACRL